MFADKQKLCRGQKIFVWGRQMKVNCSLHCPVTSSKNIWGSYTRVTDPKESRPTKKKVMAKNSLKKR